MLCLTFLGCGCDVSSRFFGMILWDIKLLSQSCITERSDSIEKDINP